jgi:hypothetical protein
MSLLGFIFYQKIYVKSMPLFKFLIKRFDRMLLSAENRVVYFRVDDINLYCACAELLEVKMARHFSSMIFAPAAASPFKRIGLAKGLKRTQKILH